MSAQVAVKAEHGHGPVPGFWRSYVFSVDHKTIGKQYMSLSLFWALVGGATAYLIRWQLAWPETSVAGWGYVEPQVYNALITMHGTIMIFFLGQTVYRMNESGNAKCHRDIFFCRYL